MTEISPKSDPDAASFLNNTESLTKGERAPRWTDEETSDLLQFWKAFTQGVEITGTIRDVPIYSKLTEAMADKGYQRTRYEIRTRINNLRSEFKRMKSTHPSSGVHPAKMQLFQELEAAFSNDVSLALSPSLVTLCGTSNDPVVDDIGVPAINPSSDPSPCDDTYPLAGLECVKANTEPELASVFSGWRTRGWSERENEAVLHLYTQCALEQGVTGTTRDGVIYDSMARLLKDRGFQRSRDEIRTRINYMRSEYRRLLERIRTNGGQVPEEKLNMYELLNSTLGRLPLAMPASALASLKELCIDHLSPAAKSSSSAESSEMNGLQRLTGDNIAENGLDYDQTSPTGLKLFPFLEGKNERWSEAEIDDLLNFYGDIVSQHELTGTSRDAFVYEIIGKRMEERGYHRTREEIRNRINNLKADYRRHLRRSIEIGNSYMPSRPEYIEKLVSVFSFIRSTNDAAFCMNHPALLPTLPLPPAPAYASMSLPASTTSASDKRQSLNATSQWMTSEPFANFLNSLSTTRSPNSRNEDQSPRPSTLSGDCKKEIPIRRHHVQNEDHLPEPAAKRQAICPSLHDMTPTSPITSLPVSSQHISPIGNHQLHTVPRHPCPCSEFMGKLLDTYRTLEEKRLHHERTLAEHRMAHELRIVELISEALKSFTGGNQTRPQ